MNSLSTPPPYWVLLFGYVVVGVPFSVGVIDTVAAVQQSADAQQAEGIVVGFQDRRPVVEYRVTGQMYQCMGLAAKVPAHPVGDRVTVLYKIHDPGTACIDSFSGRWLGPLAFVGGGLLFLTILVVVTIQKIRGPRAAPSAASQNRPTRRKRHNRCRT